MNFMMIHENPFVFIAAKGVDRWICGISPENKDNLYNGLYVYYTNDVKVIGVDLV